MNDKTKTIAIVGAGPGVGLAIAERFGAEGFNVALIARSEDKLNDLKQHLSNKKIDSAIFKADILNRTSLVKALEDAKAHFGSVDVLEFSPVPSMDSMRTPRNIDIENLEFQLNLNVLGAVTAVQTVLPEMLERKSGGLLFTTAPSAQKPLVITANAGVAAGALLNYARVLNKDLASEKIFAGIISIAGVVYSGEKPDTISMEYFPAGMPFVNAKDVAEAHWKMYQERQEFEVIVGDMDALYSVPGFF